jgi:hypothetical protein
MPHKPAQRSASEKVSYVSCSLTVDLKPQLKTWAERNEDDLLAHIDKAVMQGLRFGCKREEGGYQASLAELASNYPNSGKVLVERASTPKRAIQRLCWAHLELFETTWPGGTMAVDDDW